MCDDVVSTLWKPKTLAFVSACGAVGTMIFLYFRQKKPEVRSEASSYKGDTSTSKEMLEVENHYNMWDSYSRIPNKVKKQKLWNVMQRTPSNFKGTPKSLSQTIMRNCRRCVVFNDIERETYCLGVSSNYALIHKHACEGSNDRFVIKVSCKGGIGKHDAFRSTILYLSECVEVLTDVLLVPLQEIKFKKILTHFPVEPLEYVNAKGIIGGYELYSSVMDKDILVSSRDEILTYKNPIVYKWPAHDLGSCGIPLLVQVDSGSCVAGIHSAGSRSTDVSYAICITRGLLERSIEKIRSNGKTQILCESGILYGEEPHPKSPVRFVDLRRLDYYGAVDVPNVHQRSRLRKTILYESLENYLWENHDYVKSTVYGRPPMMAHHNANREWISPYNNWLEKAANDKKATDPHILRKCVDQFYDKLCENLKDKIIPTLQPLTLETAINGSAEDPFIRRLDVNKAGGYGTPGKKLNYMTLIDEKEHIFEPDDSIKQSILDAIHSYENGEGTSPVFKASLKDEPRSLEKVAKGAVRVFFGTPQHFLYLQRMFLSPLYSLMIEFSESFYTAIGIDMHRDSHHIYNNFLEFSRNILEGDYGGFDVSMPFGIGQAANEIVYRLLEKFGYTDDQLVVVNGLLSDNLFPQVSLLGEMLGCPGLQPSGKYATAEDNSLRGIIILLYAWNSIDELSELDFFDYVLPLVYGDDVLSSVKDEVAHAFTTKRYAQVVNEELGLRFTTSDKEEIKHDFIDIDDMTFLKRSFVFNTKLNRVVAPLSMDSICKSLEWRIPSEVINEEQQYEQSLTSALYEMFFHCDERKFKDFRRFLMQELTSHFDCEFVLPTYVEIYNALCSPEEEFVREGRQTVHPVDIVAESRAVNVISRMESRFCLHLHGKERYRYQGDKIWPSCYSLKQWSQNIQKLRNEIEKLSAQLDEYELQFEDQKDPLPGLSWNFIKKTSRIPRPGELFDVARAYHEMKNLIDAYRSTIKRLKSRMSFHQSTLDITVESGELNDGKVVTDATVENLTDMGGLLSDEKSAGSSDDLDVGQYNMIDMGDFLGRPVKIATITTAVGASVTYSVDVWDAFLSEPSVRAKLRNYAYLRGDLTIRIAVSGSPFHYAKFQVSYQPFADNNENLNYLDGLLAGAQRQASLTYFSQAPGSAVIDVKDNRPLDMICPYINVQPVIRLFNKSPLTILAATPFNDAVGLGKLYINSINVLKATSATATDVVTMIYAYIDNVQLGTLTGTVMEITTESRDITVEAKAKGNDEREVGPVETIASRASEVAGWLTAIPVIAPFAKASEIVFSGMAKIASLFGYSVPTMNSEPIYVKNRPYQNGANVIGYDTGKRITLDPKQELSVDPRSCGVDTDDMSISAICARESLLDVFTWSSSDPPMGSAIWTVPVTPKLAQRFPLGAPTPYLVAPTALSFAAAPFGYWRGSIRFRLEIVCSQFHRGKLAIIFEPNISQNVLIDSSLELNKQYFEVIDLQETTDGSYLVEWAFPKPWASNMPTSLLGDVGDVGFLGDALFDYANGYLAIVPFTALQSPDGSDVEVNVYISSDDMRFNVLLGTDLPTERPSVESRDITVESKDATPDVVSYRVLNESSASLTGVSEMYFGESPVSFRGLLKRYIGSPENDLSVVLTTDDLVGVSLRNYPAPNPDYSGITTARNDLFGYLRYAYLGMKGGMKYRFFLGNALLDNPTRNCKVSLFGKETSDFGPIIAAHGWVFHHSFIRGTVEFMLNTNDGVEYEIPFYSNNTFGLSFSDDPFPSGNSNFDASLIRRHQISVPVNRGDASTVHARLSTAIGEDFSFMRFQGAPPFMYT